MKQATEANEQLVTSNWRFFPAQDEMFNLVELLHKRSMQTTRTASNSWDAGTVIHYKPYYDRSQKHFTARPYEPAMIFPSGTETRSLTSSCSLPRTPMKTYDLPNSMYTLSIDP
jgi:hypothetical protein